jgi:hypothetical protein
VSRDLVRRTPVRNAMVSRNNAFELPAPSAGAQAERSAEEPTAMPGGLENEP